MSLDDINVFLFDKQLFDLVKFTTFNLPGFKKMGTVGAITGIVLNVVDILWQGKLLSYFKEAVIKPSL